MRIVVLGAKGQLGSDLRKTFQDYGATVIGLTRQEVDVRSPEQLRSVLAEARPQAVVNTTAFHHVESCENDPALALTVNAVAPRNIALVCRQLDAVLVHFSTDYVFGGDRQVPYTESDLPHPLNVYGASKLAGEVMVSLTWAKHLIVRTCGLYGVAGSSGKGGNFVETMLRKAKEGNSVTVVDDQVLTPTFTEDLALAVWQLLNTATYGLYHVSAEGQCSWYEFARTIFELAGLKPDLSPVKTGEFPSSVVRPGFSVLSKSKLKSIGIGMPVWQDGLRRYLERRGR